MTGNSDPVPTMTGNQRRQTDVMETTEAGGAPRGPPLPRRRSGGGELNYDLTSTARPFSGRDLNPKEI